MKLPDLTLPLHAPTAMYVCSGNEVEFDAPDDDRLAPRGLCMLWLVTDSGAPSRAEWVVLR